MSGSASGTAERDAALVMLERIPGTKHVTVGGDKAYVPCMLCRAGINRAPTRSLQILGHVRRNLQVPAFSYEIR